MKTTANPQSQHQLQKQFQNLLQPQLQHRVLELTKQLMQRQSVTPEDGGCQDIIARRLAPLGFDIEEINAGDVRNLWAYRTGHDPHLMFAGHTDVVPTGPVTQWHSPPFTPTVSNGKLYGRGAADMKSSLAAMVVATEDAVRQGITGTLSFLLTSDEEGVAVNGTKHVVAVLAQRGIKPDYCVVGEPSSNQVIGDVIRCGRRGSLNALLTVNGIQGHVAYPGQADNPIHPALTALDALVRTEWDHGNEHYPPTSFQISNINAGTGATNVIPGQLKVMFNFRFSSELTAAAIQQRVNATLQQQQLACEIDWQHSGDPFLTTQGQLTDTVTAAIKSTTGVDTQLSTSGGTSDGRFISPWNLPASASVDVVELGPTNATIHQIDECIGLDELVPLTQIYQKIIHGLV